MISPFVRGTQSPFSTPRGSQPLKDSLALTLSLVRCACTSMAAVCLRCRCSLQRLPAEKRTGGRQTQDVRRMGRPNSNNLLPGTAVWRPRRHDAPARLPAPCEFCDSILMPFLLKMNRCVWKEFASLPA